MPHRIGFNHAFSGLKHAFATQPNFRVHVLIALAALILALLLRLNRFEWLILILTIVLVFVAEMINTALESITDLVEEKYHASAKIAKDVSAGMVLLSAFMAVVIGLVIFIPKL